MASALVDTTSSGDEGGSSASNGVGVAPFGGCGSLGDEVAAGDELSGCKAALLSVPTAPGATASEAAAPAVATGSGTATADAVSAVVAGPGGVPLAADASFSTARDAAPSLTAGGPTPSAEDWSLDCFVDSTSVLVGATCPSFKDPSLPSSADGRVCGDGPSPPPPKD